MATFELSNQEPPMQTGIKLKCAHCGEPAGDQPVWQSGHVFCCNGCLSVYNILNQSGLCEYYVIDEKAGISPVGAGMVNKIESDDELELMAADFTIAENTDNRVLLFYVPAIHCASCIWLLEKLNHLDKGIISSRTNFVQKQVTVAIDPSKTSFSSVIRLLTSLGYEPSLMPENNDKSERDNKRRAIIKMGVAGFCAGNIMMFSFPQYLGLAPNEVSYFKSIFDLGNILLSIPLVVYCSSEYFRSFFNWITKRVINVKVPLAIGIAALWGRSIYEAVTHTGPGYFDSLAGLVFFLLIGQWMQNRTFDGLRFGEKARKFFPLVSRVVIENKTQARRVVDLKAGDRIQLKSNEIVPADCILLHSDAYLDYSYATGESTPVHKVAGELLYAGGKNTGSAIVAEVVRPFDEGRFAGIWQSSGNEQNTQTVTTQLEKKISVWFVTATILLALVSLICWLPVNEVKAWFVFTAVLMVACPCALALAPPFAWNTLAGFFASKGFFLRKPEVTGILGEAKNIVFDKTGTLTDENQCYAGFTEMPDEETLRILLTLTSQSTHPYSVAISRYLEHYLPFTGIAHFKEFPGKGLFAEINEKCIKVGSAEWVGVKTKYENDGYKKVFFSIDDQVFSPIVIHDNFRYKTAETLEALNKMSLNLSVASGDVSREKDKLQKNFGRFFKEIFMECSPVQKVEILEAKKATGKTLMIGDGINDAAALKSADAGIVMTKDTTQFVPEASAILLNEAFHHIPQFLSMAKKANRIVFQTFLVSLIYNIIALTLAVSGLMTPLTAAVIMPVSSIALMLYARFAALYLVKKNQKL